MEEQVTLREEFTVGTSRFTYCPMQERIDIRAHRRIYIILMLCVVLPLLVFGIVGGIVWHFAVAIGVFAATALLAFVIHRENNIVVTIDRTGITRSGGFRKSGELAWCQVARLGALVMSDKNFITIHRHREGRDKGQFFVMVFSSPEVLHVLRTHYPDFDGQPLEAVALDVLTPAQQKELRRATRRHGRWQFWTAFLCYFLVAIALGGLQAGLDVFASARDGNTTQFTATVDTINMPEREITVTEHAATFVIQWRIDIDDATLALIVPGETIIFRIMDFDVEHIDTVGEYVIVTYLRIGSAKIVMFDDYNTIVRRLRMFTWLIVGGAVLVFGGAAIGLTVWSNRLKGRARAEYLSSEESHQHHPHP